MKKAIKLIDGLVSLAPLAYCIGAVVFAKTVYNVFKKLPFVDFNLQGIDLGASYSTIIFLGWAVLLSLFIKPMTSFFVQKQMAIPIHKQPLNYIYAFGILIIFMAFATDSYLFFDWFYFD
ncbi:MAG: hypothetical protein K0S33_1131 [Bacteroidetes bacterium]|jgi:hypothetical protein|nr:hypothetical protein [Bacteroidota bacterium]